MLRVATVQAKPGMKLAMALFHPERHDTILLKAGVELDERIINRLKEIELRELWVEYPAAEFVAQYISPEIFAANAHLTEKISEAISSISVTACAKLDYAAYRRAISGLLEKLIADPKAAVFIQEMVDRSQPTLQHASNVCFLSLLMGLNLEDYIITQRSRLSAVVAREVSNLGVGAMLHDMGMLRLDPQTLGRWYEAHNEDDPEWRKHPQIGFEIVQGAVDASASAAVLHHHQRYDGSGFPKRQLSSGGEAAVMGKDIHVFARIIAAADVFDRLRNPPAAEGSPESKQRSKPVVWALKQMLSGSRASWFDPMVFKALLSICPPYPPGSIVHLSNGSRGVVREWFANDPCRPTVLKISDDDDDLVTSNVDEEVERFVLAERPGLEIVKAEGVDVSEDNFYPSYADQFDLRVAGKALFNGAA